MNEPSMVEKHIMTLSMRLGQLGQELPHLLKTIQERAATAPPALQGTLHAAIAVKGHVEVALRQSR